MSYWKRKLMNFKMKLIDLENNARIIQNQSIYRIKARKRYFIKV